MLRRALPSDIFQLVCSHTLNALLCTDPTVHNPFTALNNKDFQFLPCKIKDCCPITQLTFILLILPKSVKGHRNCTQFRILLQLIKKFKMQNFIVLPSWRRCKGRKTYRIYKANSLFLLTAPKHPEHPAGFALNETHLLLPEQTHHTRWTISCSLIHTLPTHVNSVTHCFGFFFTFSDFPLAHPDSSIFQRTCLPSLLVFN